MQDAAVAIILPFGCRIDSYRCRETALIALFRADLHLDFFRLTNHGVDTEALMACEAQALGCLTLRELQGQDAESHQV